MSIPWKTIKERYIAGATQREICEEYGIGRTALTDRIRKEHWSEERTNERTKADKRTMQIVRRKASAQQRKTESRVETGTDEIIRLVGRLTKATDLAIDRFMDNPKSGATSGEQLAGMVKTTIQLYRDAYDIPTGAEIESRELAHERLALEKERVHPTEDTTLTIKLSKELEDIAEWQS